MLRLNAERLRQKINQCDAFRTVGKLRSSRNLLTATFPGAVGDLCQLEIDRDQYALAEVIGFDHGTARILPFDAVEGLRVNSRVLALNHQRRIPVGPELLGRVIDGLGRPLDGKGPIHAANFVTPRLIAPEALQRQRITQPFITGQRVIDGLLSMGRGQRIGLFAGSGVGKSSLLGEIAKGAESDINVIALIGERGREVRPFLDDCLGPEGLARSIVVISTADQTPLMRVRAAEAAVSVADYFRQRGGNVLFMLDSMTRVAGAQREIGLHLGEPPSARGYTPSVFQVLARMLEQLGNSDAGSITGIVTVLVDGDDMDEPITDSVRSIVDGHIVLDRQLAEKSHFPAVNPGRSISRVFRDVTSPAHQDAAAAIRTLMATYNEVVDLIRVGAYEKGSAPDVDRAIKLMPAVNAMLRQDIGMHTPLNETVKVMQQIANAWKHEAVA